MSRPTRRTVVVGRHCHGRQSETTRAAVRQLVRRDDFDASSKDHDGWGLSYAVERGHKVLVRQLETNLIVSGPSPESTCTVGAASPNRFQHIFSRSCQRGLG